MLRRGGNLQTCRFDSRPVGAAIILWNTVYITHAVHELRTLGQAIDDDLLAHLAPLGLEHINLTGDYEWNPSSLTEISELRPLRLPASNLLLAA